MEEKTLPAQAVRTDAVITTRKLSKTFSTGGSQQHVLRNIDLDIRRGDFTVIMGPSGSGKSTLLYAISGMDRPTLGEVAFAGTEISGFSEDRLARFRRGHCGFVFQQVYLLDAMSVLDNVMAVGLLGRGSRREVASRARALFDRVGLTDRDIAKTATMLSGGEAQRAAIVRALINEPDVLFADEPTGQLNSEYSTKVLDLLSGLNAEGQSIVMVTHDLRSALRGNRVLYLADGRVRGELSLGAYDAAAEDERHARTVAFLDQMGW